MTKDGRPSRLSDIRLFAGMSHSYLEGFEDVVAFARRVAWFLNGEEFSIGAHTHMYVFFSPSTAIGAANVVEQGMDWWFRYTYVGAPRELVRSSDTAKMLEDGVVAALKANRPDKADIIDGAVDAVRTHGNRMRFLMKVKETKTYVAETAFTIGAFGQEATAIRTLRTEKSSGALFARCQS